MAHVMVSATSTDPTFQAVARSELRQSITSENTTFDEQLMANAINVTDVFNGASVDVTGTLSLLNVSSLVADTEARLGIPVVALSVSFNNLNHSAFDESPSAQQVFKTTIVDVMNSVTSDQQIQNLRAMKNGIKSSVMFSISKEDKSSSSSDTALVAGVVSGGLVFLLIVAVVTILVYQKRCKNPPGYKPSGV